MWTVKTNEEEDFFLFHMYTSRHREYQETEKCLVPLRCVYIHIKKKNKISFWIYIERFDYCTRARLVMTQQRSKPHRERHGPRRTTACVRSIRCIRITRRKLKKNRKARARALRQRRRAAGRTLAVTVTGPWQFLRAYSYNDFLRERIIKTRTGTK